MKSGRQCWKGRSGRGKAHQYSHTGTWEDKKLEDTRPCRKVRAQHAQIFTSSPVRPEAAQPAADSPPPHTVSPCQAPAFRVLLGVCESHWCRVTLDACRGMTCGGCAVSPEGCQQLTSLAPLQRGDRHFTGAQGPAAVLCKVMRSHSPLRHTHRSSRGGWCIPVL